MKYEGPTVFHHATVEPESDLRLHRRPCHFGLPPTHIRSGRTDRVAPPILLPNMRLAILVTLFAAGVALGAPSNCSSSTESTQGRREYEHVYVRRDSSTARDAAKVRKGMRNVAPGAFMPGTETAES
ncbi:hypothetical protein OF83DRAFT_1290368 [Amylostereum chailletii]|nr:hypothetical protein OF83DRAFT_1290368 [Amylostereum chailletii]